MSVAARLAGLELRGDDEALVRLGELWSEAPRVLVFLRHFG